MSLRALPILASATAPVVLAIAPSVYATVLPVTGAAGQTQITIPGPNAGTYWTPVPVPITATALAADPRLANYNTWDIRVSISPGDHWGGADMRAQLYGTLKFYIPSSNDSNSVPSSSTRTAQPNLTF